MECIQRVFSASASAWEEQQRLWVDMVQLALISSEPPACQHHHRILAKISSLDSATVSAVRSGDLTVATKRKYSADSDKTKGGPGDVNRSIAKAKRRQLDIPVDKEGRPIMPLKIGNSLTIHCLGEVIHDIPAFHSDKYIWPVGYKASRSYMSLLNPLKRTEYLCEIKYGERRPVFQVTPMDCPDQALTAHSASGVWSKLIKKLNDVRTEAQGKRTMTTISGPEYYGLSLPQIRRLIWELPNAMLCLPKEKAPPPNTTVPEQDEAQGDLEADISRGGDGGDVSLMDTSQDDLQLTLGPTEPAAESLAQVDQMSVYRRYWSAIHRGVGRPLEFEGRTRCKALYER